MITTMTGLNSFALKEAVKKLTNDFILKYGEFGLEKIEAGDVDFGRLLESVASLPFLANKRMIILRDPSANKALVENIEQLIETVSDTTELVIVEPKIDKRSVFYKTLKNKTDFKDFVQLDERQLAEWLVGEAKSRGSRLSFGDATYLIQRAGNDQLGLSHELEKLVTYNPAITRESIEMLVEPLPQGSVFDLLDAAFSGDHKKTEELYINQRKQQVEPQAIMGMIAWQLHVLALVKVNQKETPEGIASKTRLSPFVIRKTLNIARKISLVELKDLIRRVLDLDVRLKSQQIDADDAVQHLLLSLG